MSIRQIAYNDPIAAFAPLSGQPYAVLLDSAAPSASKDDRYSIIATSPLHIVTATADQVHVDGMGIMGDPFGALNALLKKYTPRVDVDSALPFRGGAIGYFGYELGGWLEKLPAPKQSAQDTPQMWFGIYDVVAIYDHEKQQAFVTGDNDLKVEALARKLEEHVTLPPVDWRAQAKWQANLSRDAVEQRIDRVIDYICAGDIYQANFTQRFTAQKPDGLDDFMLYRRLRALSPAPYAGFMRCGEDFSLCSASPESFLRLTAEGQITTRPIKGTRPRGETRTQDAELAAELKNSAKDRAENLMIVDLLRNDLSRVAELGSVRVPDLCALESFAKVHHLTSTITAQLREGLGPLDLVRATFPGGSITGAPKIRAMEIIHELETVPRGAYCGAMGWIGFDGAMALNILIRTLRVSGDVIMAQAGGGIVADSDPAAEYEESMVKLAPLLAAVSGNEDAEDVLGDSQVSQQAG